MKKRDEGFSLVELIVVIAIMAVLVGILAPVYLKYVEKARKSTDIQNMGQIIDAANVYATEGGHGAIKDAELKISASGGDITLSITLPAGASAEAEEYAENAESAWRDTANSGDPYKLISKDWKAMDGVLIGTFSSEEGLVWTVQNSEGVFQAMVDYSDDFKQKIR